MAIIEQSEAIKRMQPHFSALFGCIGGAWDDYISYPVEKRVVHSSRSRASLVHDHMIDRAAKYAARTENVKIVEKKGLFLFVFEAQIAVRFKKFDEDLKTKNQPSNQVQLFKNQVQLDGVEAAHNLESGYILSADAQSLAAVHLVCPSGTGVYWDVLLTAHEQIGVVQDLFANQIDSEERGAKIRRRESATIIQLNKDGKES